MPAGSTGCTGVAAARGKRYEGVVMGLMHRGGRGLRERVVRGFGGTAHCGVRAARATERAGPEIGNPDGPDDN